MIKEAIEEIVRLAAPSTLDVEGKMFLVDKNSSNIFEIHPEPEFPQCLSIYSLEALVKMIDTEAMNIFDKPLYVNVESFNIVNCYTQPLNKLRNQRGEVYQVRACDVPGWEENVQLPFEEALIAIRTRFQQTPDSEYLLRLLSDITNGAKVTYADNGIASSVVTQKGVALQDNSVIRPIVKLKPYRTFQEVDQPESEFHIRVSERGIRFIEADGGMWKLHARRTVAAFLRVELQKYVNEDSVVVTI